jgi:ABC-type transport system substrate-binding protein
MQWLASVLGAGLLAIAVSPTKLTAADNVVGWASNREVETFDPHATDELQALWVHAYVYEPLVAYDWQWRLEPALAESWRVVDPTTTEPLGQPRLARCHVQDVTELHGAEAPAHSGDLEPYTLDHANGSGPFRLESFAPRERLVLIRNPTGGACTALPQQCRLQPGLR